MMPAPAFRQIAPGRLEVRAGGGRMAIVGLPFVVVGVASSLVALGILPLQSFRITGTSLPALLVIGLTFTLVGGTLVFGRSWTTVSSADRTVVKQVGLLVPMSTRTYRIDDYNGVILEFIRGDSDTSDSYPVSLKARAGRNLRLFSSTQYAEAREQATAVAELLHMDIEDSTSGRPVRLSATEANMSLQMRQRMSHERDELVVRPASMKSTVTETNGVVSIVIPGRRPQTITASTAGVRIEERRLFSTRTIASFAAADIVDVAYTIPETAAEIQRRRPAMAAPPAGKGTEWVIALVRALVGSGGITITARKGMTTFGARLDDREVRYLHYMVRRALSPNP